MIFVVPIRLALSNLSCALVRKRIIVLTLAVLLLLSDLHPARAEDEVAYRFEYYKENDGRMEILTHGVGFDATLKEGLLSINGELVYDALSGATPNGAAPPYKYNFDNTFGLITGNTSETHVPMATLAETEVRKAVSIATPVTLGLHTLTPQVAYSQESDYKSTGAALNYALLLNEKNTTLTCGWAHTWDKVKDAAGPGGVYQDKAGDDFLIGISQLLSPKTVLGFNLTYGQSQGFLNDPYRSISYSQEPVFIYTGAANDFVGAPEKRPGFKNKIVGRASLTQFISPVNASVEAAYRYYRDSFGISAHTLELAWYQKFGKHVILSPNVRFYRQSAASFYTEMLTSIGAEPQYYSADYRLSQMETIAPGLNLVVKATKNLSLDVSYKYYTTRGLDGVTSQTAYPKANVFSIGARFHF